MNVQFLHTEVVDDTHYIDVLNVDGKIYTQQLHKVSEPNNFAVEKQEDGNQVEKFKKEFEKTIDTSD